MGSAPQPAGCSTSRSVAEQPFSIHLANFDGPFDLLLGLITRHQLDITEVALSQVTNEFIAHVKQIGPDLEQLSEFVVVAATLLDLKAARLLPAAEVEDEDDLAALEARDLLFARLLQYRAFKQVAAAFEQRLQEQSRRHPRAVGLDERFARLLPEVVLRIGADQFAAVAAKALRPRPAPAVSLAHLHAPTVSVREQAAVLVERLRRLRQTTFRSLVADSPDTVTTVARFLALLTLYREGAVGFDQMVALGELHLRWTGDDESDVAVGTEFDVAEPDGAALDGAGAVPGAEEGR